MAYRSGEKILNQWDGITHDYTHKSGVIHSEIILPSHAPPALADRSNLWNSVELAEKATNSQLAREIEIDLPVELTEEEQINLVRTYVQDSFVAAGMCADFSIHDKADGNPHAHIMLTMRPLLKDGSWGAKCRKVYDLNAKGLHIPDGKGGWKNHRENVNDWNDREKAEVWRKSWADYANRALEQAGHSERIDNHSYARQGVEKIPSIHWGVAAWHMEQRGIVTEKGSINRQIAKDNELLVEIENEIIRLRTWAKQQTKTDTLKQKIVDLNSAFYVLRGDIVSKEKQIAALNERLEMWRQYQKYLPLHKKLPQLKSKKQQQFQEEHRAEFILFSVAKKYLAELKKAGEKIEPKKWRQDIATQTDEKDLQYQQMQKMREEIKEIECQKKVAEQQTISNQNRNRNKEDLEL